MRTINTTFKTFGASLLLLGLKGDSNATEILIDCAESLEEYQGTMAAMSITGPDDTVYPGDISLDENGIVHWVVAARDCGIAGHGSARVDLVDDEGTVVASAEARTIIMKTNMQGVAPDQIANWTEAASVALQEARAALLDLIDLDTTATANEAARQLAETGRVSAETLRASAETARASAETARATAENTRASAESTRIAAENTRASAESTRIAAENARVSEFSTIEANAQAALSYIGPSEASSTASAAHTKGTYFTYNGKLYEATADIAAGDTITAGTNCAQVPGGAMGEVSELKSAISIMNDGGKIDFYHGDATFYGGYYNGTPAYTGNGSIASPPFTGWNVLLVHVIAGKTIKISGMPTASGTLSVWLNSSTLTDIKETAWNSSLNNGTKTCKSDWLALSGNKIDPSTVSIVYEERKDLQDQIDANAERAEGFVDDITESLAYSDMLNAVTGLNLVGCSCVTAKQQNAWIETTVLSGLTLTSGRKYKILCRADGIMDVSGYVKLHKSDGSVLQNSPAFSGKSSVSFTYKASSDISGAYIAVSYGSTTPHTFMTYFYEFAEGANKQISEVVYDSTSLRNGSILNGSNANFVALPVVLTQASKIRVLTNRPNSENCVYKYQYYTATAIHEDLIGTSDYTGYAEYRNNVYSITNSVPRVGVQVAITEYNTTTGEISALRVADFEGYLIYIADISAEETNLIGDLPYYYDDYMTSRIGTIREKDLTIANTGESFIFITDIHERTKYYSPLLAEYIIKNTSVDRLIYGGDYINQPSSKDSAVGLLYRFVGVGRVIDDAVFMRGNHETNPYGTGQLTSGEVYQILNSHIEKYTDTDQKNYYVIDNESQKIRELFIDTGESGEVDSEQLAWITARVQELGSDWTIIVFSHLGIYASGKDVRSPISFYPVMDDVLPILRNATAKVACWVCGHVHKDLVYTEETFPIIAVTCDANGVQASNASSDARESGTINEHAFDVFHVDTNAKVVYATRIGGGQYNVITTEDLTDNDRQWSYT